MMSNLGDMDDELDEASVAEHLRNADMRNYGDQAYLQFSNFEKCDATWANLLARQKSSMDESDPQDTHLSPEQSNITDLASFEYNQRLPSMESSSSAPIGRTLGSLTSPSLFAWQPFGTPSSLHSQSQASSVHGAGGHLFPLVSGSLGSSYGAEFSTHSPSSSVAVSVPGAQLDAREKQDSQFNPLTYANVSAAIVASGRLRVTVASPPAHDLQSIRMDVGLSSIANPSSAVTPVPAYAHSGGSSNSQSSTPAHQSFGFQSNGSCSAMSQQLTSTANSSLTGQPYDDHSKSVNFRQRSKKESHNRIERKRRDYINSQIVYLSSLLPPELYRDVDGRRNKGSVLRLSVNYIKELREAVAQMTGLKQENTLARQLIPLLLKRIESLERIIQEQTSSSPSTGQMRHSASFESLYQSWLVVNESNQRSASNGKLNNLAALSRSSGQPFPPPPQSLMNDPAYFHDAMHTDADSAELELTGALRCGSSSSSSNNTATNHNNTRLVNVKREQTEEDRLVESAPARVRLDASSSRLPVSCALLRSAYSDHSSTAQNRIEEEITALTNINFENQPSLSYERYHRLMQPTCQPGVFGQNE